MEKRKPIPLYDVRGVPIQKGDLLKVFHFIGARRKKYFMYKMVGERDGFLIGLHYPFSNKGGYDLQCQANKFGIILGTTVVESIGADFEDRKRLKVKKEMLISREGPKWAISGELV